jgi:hypothetical protein
MFPIHYPYFLFWLLVVRNLTMSAHRENSLDRFFIDLRRCLWLCCWLLYHNYWENSLYFSPKYRLRIFIYLEASFIDTIFSIFTPTSFFITRLVVVLAFQLSLAILFLLKFIVLFLIIAFILVYLSWMHRILVLAWGFILFSIIIAFELVPFSKNSSFLYSFVQTLSIN